YLIDQIPHGSEIYFRFLQRRSFLLVVLMAAMAVTHTAHAMNGSSAGFSNRPTTNPLHRARVALASATGALAVHAAAFAVNTGALAMDATAFPMDGRSILSIRRCLT